MIKKTQQVMLGSIAVFYKPNHVHLPVIGKSL